MGRSTKREPEPRQGRIAGRRALSPNRGFILNRAASRRLAHDDPLARLMRERQHMFQIHREELDWAGRKLVIETGKIARQADGAVFASWGETTVLATIVAAKAPKPGQDFFPLTVNYQEKAFAAGRIPGGYFKREGPPVRARDAGLASDRPPDPSAVRRWLSQRDAGDRHRAVARSGKRSRHSRLGRRLRRANAFRRALHGPHRRRPRRPYQRRAEVQSDHRGNEELRSSISSSPAPPTPC